MLSLTTNKHRSGLFSIVLFFFMAMDTLQNMFMYKNGKCLSLRKVWDLVLPFPH